VTEGRRSGGLRKRTKPFTPIPNETVDDYTIPFRSLGILVALLRKPDGWDVRSEQLANEGKHGENHTSRREGREAIRTALRELAVAGYYRLEKIRLLGGQFVMSTAVSEDRVESWALQAQLFDGKAVPLYEQPDGTLMVRYPDGSMHPDDFPPPTATPTNRANSGDGFPGAGPPGPGNPASGNPASGDTSPLEEGLPQRGYQDSVPPSEVRRNTHDPSGTCVQQILAGDAEPGSTEPSERDVAFGIGRAWIDYRLKQGTPVVVRGRIDPLHVLARLIEPALKSGYTEVEVKLALNHIGAGVPSAHQLDRALTDVRAGRSSGNGNVRPLRAVTDVNAAWADVAPQHRPAVAGGRG
jgi:hypothetical protein